MYNDSVTKIIAKINNGTQSERNAGHHFRAVFGAPPFHAKLSNHLHLMLRTRPDIAKRWSRQEVARRWLTITHIAKCMFDGLTQVKEERIEQLARDKKKIQELRICLSSISWFMAILCKNIARRANNEDKCHGRFF